MNKKANWNLPAVFGIVGLGLLADAIWIKEILAANRFVEGVIGILLVILAIWIYNKN